MKTLAAAALLLLSIVVTGCASNGASNATTEPDFQREVSEPIAAPFGADWYMRRDPLNVGEQELWYAEGSSFSQWRNITSPLDLVDTKLGGDRITVWYRSRLPVITFAEKGTIILEGLPTDAVAYVSERKFTADEGTIRIPISNVSENRSLLDLYLKTSTGGDDTGVGGPIKAE